MKKYQLFENDFLSTMYLYRCRDFKNEPMFLYWLPKIQKYTICIKEVYNDNYKLIHSKNVL